MSIDFITILKRIPVQAHPVLMIVAVLISYWLNDNDTTHFYRYLKAKKRFVGEVAYHFNDDKCMLDIIIHHKYRKKGYGTQGLSLLLDEAKSNKIEEVYDDIAIDNNGIKLFLNFGFEELYRTKDIIMLKKDLKEKSDTNVPD